MSSASSPVRAVLEGYVAGRVKAERVAAAVTETYYGREMGGGMRAAWRPMMEVIERAHPGVVELAGTGDRPGFAIRLAERPFPREFEGALRGAVEAYLNQAPPASRLPPPGVVSRLMTAIRRLFSAST